MKWCIIGAGGIADRRTIPAILKDPESEIVAVMDKVPAAAEAIGKKYGVKSYTDEKTMLDECYSDAVYIGTPVNCHEEQAYFALSRGRHVFMEKPITVSYEAGDKLVAAFKKKNKQLTVGYMMKYHNLHGKAKKMIADGDIGGIVDVRAQFSCWYPDIAGAWRQNKALGGGGAAMDLGVHAIELIEFMLGENISEVKSFYDTSTFSYEVEDSAVFIFRTQSGIKGHIDVNFNIPDAASESKLELYGTDGYIILKGTLGQEEAGEMSYLYAPQGDYDAKQSRTVGLPRKYRGKGGDLYLKQIKDFIKTVESGKTDYKYADEAVHVQEIIEKIYADDVK